MAESIHISGVRPGQSLASYLRTVTGRITVERRDDGRLEVNGPEQSDYILTREDSLIIYLVEGRSLMKGDRSIVSLGATLLDIENALGPSDAPEQLATRTFLRYPTELDSNIVISLMLDKGVLTNIQLIVDP